MIPLALVDMSATTDEWRAALQGHQFIETPVFTSQAPGAISQQLWDAMNHAIQDIYARAKA